MIHPMQVIQKQAGTPSLIEVVSASVTAAFSKAVFYPGQVLRLLPTANMEIKFCREYLAGPEFGRSRFEKPITDIWVSDAEGAQVADKIWWNGELTTQSQVTLDKTKGSLTYSHVLEFKLDDQDDVIRTRAMQDQYGLYVNTPLTDLMFSINHKESNVAQLLQVQFRKEVKGAYKYWTYGGPGSWGAGVAWNDITGSAAEAWLQSGIVTPDENVPITVALRPKADAAAETSHASHIGLHENLAFGGGTFLAQDVEYFFAPRYRCRIGTDMSAGSGSLYISEMVA